MLVSANFCVNFSVTFSNNILPYLPRKVYQQALTRYEKLERVLRERGIINWSICCFHPALYSWSVSDSIGLQFTPTSVHPHHQKVWTLGEASSSHVFPRCNCPYWNGVDPRVCWNWTALEEHLLGRCQKKKPILDIELLEHLPKNPVGTLWKKSILFLVLPPSTLS